MRLQLETFVRVGLMCLCCCAFTESRVIEANLVNPCSLMLSTSVGIATADRHTNRGFICSSVTHTRTFSSPLAIVVALAIADRVAIVLNAVE